MDISCDSVDPMDLGIARFSWWLNPHIAGYCYHLGIAQNHRRAYTDINAKKFYVSINFLFLFFPKRWKFKISDLLVCRISQKNDNVKFIGV